MGLASVACYLSLYLDILLPRDTVFLGEVHYHGGIAHPEPMTDHYLDFCLREGFNIIVGPSDCMEDIRDVVAEDRYQGITLIELDNAQEIVTKLFQLLPRREDGACAGLAGT